MIRCALSLLAGLGLGLAAAPAAVAIESVADVHIMRLEEELESAANPDSIALELATAYRQIETTEGKVRALALLDKIEKSHREDPRFYWERAETYRSCGHFSLACGALRRLLEMEPDTLAHRISLARLMLAAAPRQYRTEQFEPVFDVLEDALDLAPGNRELLFLKSLALQYLCGLLGQGSTDCSQEGLQLAEQLIQRDSQDISAWLLHAVHCLDLAALEQAEFSFRCAISQMSPEVAAAFLSPNAISTSEERKVYDNLAADEQPRFAHRFWNGQDPLPLSVTNERQLEVWKRMALADFFFGVPEKGLRGWDTDMGSVFVRYGAPHGANFVHGNWQGGEGTQAEDPTRVWAKSLFYRAGKLVLPFQSPAVHWQYVYGDRAFSLKFEDLTLSGLFYADSPSRLQISELDGDAPALFPDDRTAGRRAIFFAGHAGFRSAGGKTSDRICLGIAPGSISGRRDWWKGAECVVRLQDESGGLARATTFQLTEANRAELVPRGELLLISFDHTQPAGNYLLSCTLVSPVLETRAAVQVPISIAGFEGDGLMLSELELGLAAGELEGEPAFDRLGHTLLPNPSAVVGDQRWLVVYYEIYNLLPRGGGETKFQVRYTVLPREYLISHQVRTNLGRVAADDPGRFGQIGKTLDGLTLTTSNYVDFAFMPERVTLPAGSRHPRVAQVPVEGLDPGNYILVVTVTDLVANRMISSQTPFRVLRDEEIAAELSPGT